MNFKIIRKITRSSEWQLLYNRAKELGTLRLFKNDIDLTKVQLWFLHFLEVYSSLYMDLAMKEKYISEDVIQDDLRTEAYLLYKKEKKPEEEKNRYTGKNKKRVPAGDIPKVEFVRK